MICSLFRGRRVHLMGIGGAGVSALVPLLRDVGAIVSGCDTGESPTIARLRAEGVPVRIGHAEDHVNDVDVVVHTAAVVSTHTELAAARSRGIPVLTRGECLVELMSGTRTIAVSGSHGKTTTTWMIGHLLTESGSDPVVMVGGSVASIGGGARTGKGDLFVAETDESDGSFAAVDPEIAIVTNLDHEHLQHYGNFAALENHFKTWLARVPTEGAVIVPVHGVSDLVLSDVIAPIIRCGLHEGDYHARDLQLGPDGSRMTVVEFGQVLDQVEVPIPGAHMALNALMAIAAVRFAAPGANIAMLGTCERVRRRFTVHGMPNRVRIVEDYGHHPTEVRATIAAARLAGGRVHVLFQPHRYSRTADCFTEFVAAFDDTHAVVLLPIYAASESPIPGIDSRLLADSIRMRRTGEAPVHYTADEQEAVELIARETEPGDTILVLGAGSVGELAVPLLRFFRSAGLDQTVAAGLSGSSHRNRREVA